MHQFLPPPCGGNVFKENASVHNTNNNITFFNSKIKTLGKQMKL